MADESRVSGAGSSENLLISEDTDTPDSQGTKKRKAMAKRSQVWHHFETSKEIGVDKAKCKYCKKVLGGSTLNGTTGLHQHLNLRCTEYPPNKHTNQAIIDLTQKDGATSTGYWKYDPEVARKALLEMIIIDELPFSFVEKEGFRRFMSKVQPLFHVPSRRTLTRDCYTLYGQERQSLKNYFRDVQAKVCLTTDTWTSVQRINYMCLTAHFIDRDWVLHKRILNFCPISSHKGEDMACAINNCLLDWSLDKVFTITVDNASSNDVTVRRVSKQLTDWGTNIMDGKHLHVRCVAHILNLVVQDGLKEIDPSVERVRIIVKYIRQSPSRLRKFYECVEKQKIEYSKALVLDVPTRWNSTYMMLEVAQHYQTAFEMFQEEDTGVSDYLKNYICDDGSVASAKKVDWVSVRTTVKFLVRFYDLTLKVSGTRYVTSNAHFEEIAELAVHLKVSMRHVDPKLAEMAKGMKQKFDKYWGDPKLMNKMIFIPSVLDPRNKFVYVDHALDEMYETEVATKIRDDTKTYLTSLFGEYVPKYSTGTITPQSSPPSSCETSLDTSSEDVGLLRNKLQVKRQKEDSGSVGAKSELEKYLSEEQEPFNKNFNVLGWWKINAPRFPILSELARDVLAIPISSVASECAFSTGGRILDQFRSSLTPKLVQSLICLQDWLRSEPLPINIEEDLDYLEQIEMEIANSGRDSSIVDV